ncbi:HIRAN [Desulfofarcimen acetoxidans DSM 771]|uniref:HIRAN n=1 Tax=Desulfofarcimen acetoxidans (strain ATCC 49208 / DSM 771 / KCTC 5769 / VKM B-1644 / 5575) TaxID=485916 RepID=C8W5J7_DESAS|nr:HIRAN domain-containing protein [Desulfofarcimen acetoxidans]ACV63997.1 HIRAN [Desulfofarcimen acetoxidans DSM 771]
MKTTVMTIANRLHYTQGMSRSQALKTDWQMVKQGKFYTKVRGVTFGNRQKALARLRNYSPDEITINLVGDLNNEADLNAVAIVVEVIGKGSYQLGYLKKEHAQVIAPLPDKGVKVTARLESITGGTGKNRFRNFGANISFALVA